MALTVNFTSELVQYLLSEYFNGDIDLFAKHVGYGKGQLKSWKDGRTRPQSKTIRWILSSVLTPNFSAICEYSVFDCKSESEISSRLGEIFGAHEPMGGIYAFYDSMCNLIYLGKASSKLRAEMYQQLRANLGVQFPNAIKLAPKKRWQATAYVSANEIPNVDHIDYPKHVEAIILRLSKPIGNKILGKIPRKHPPQETE